MAYKTNPYAGWVEVASAGLAAQATIALRLQMFALAAWGLGPRADQEASRMVWEKVSATMAGWRDASAYMMRQGALDPRRAASAYAPERLAGAATAFARPGMRKAKANARRLSRQSPARARRS
ncbi:MAG: hypothetical protein AAGC56_12420 [Pseudomonadota bacterium]